MPLRANLFDKLTGVFLARKVTGSGRVATTLAASVAAAATSATLTDATDAADKNILLFGAGEEHEALVQNGAPAGAVVTVFTGFKKAHVSGEAVGEAVAYDLGDVSAMRLMDAADRGDIPTDLERNPSGSRLGFLKYALGGRIPSLDAHHLAMALGLPFASLLGAGTQADPTQFFTDGDGLCREPSWLIISALDEEGNTIYAELDACDADYTKVALPLSQGPEAGLDLELVARMHPRFIKALPNALADVSFRCKPGHYPESLIDSGFFEINGAGANTTLSSAASKDANTIAVASATSMAGGEYYLLEGGGKTQIIWSESFSNPTLTLRTRLGYAFPATTTTVKELSIVRPGGSREGSTQFAVGGTVRPVRFDQSRVQAGVRAGESRFSLGFAPTQFTLDTLRRRMALPSGAVAGSVLTVSDLVGTDAPVGCFAKVQRKDGKTAWLLLTTVENTLAQLELGLSKADMWAVPLDHMARRVQYLQY